MRNTGKGDGVMVQGLRVLAAPTEDEGLIPSTHMLPHNYLGDPIPSFVLCRHCIHVVNMHT